MGDAAPLPGAKPGISEKELYVLSLARTFLVIRTFPLSHKEKFHAHLSQVQHQNSAEFMTSPCGLWPTVNTEEFLLHCFKGCFLSVKYGLLVLSLYTKDFSFAASLRCYFGGSCAQMRETASKSGPEQTY